MELLAGDCRKRVADDFAEEVDPFDASGGGCDWMYGSRQSGSLRPQEHDDALATLADLASPPQKLKPIRCGGVKPPPSSEDRHPLDILAGTLDRLPEMGFLGDGCFEAPLGSKIADVEQSGQLTRGFAKEDHPQMDFEGPISRNRTSWDGGVSLSSSVDSDSDSSPGVGKTVTGKRKRKTTRDKLEHFLEKLVGSMMKRQEKMHNQLINVMEKMEQERIHREEAWRQQELERIRQNEEARKQEMSRSLSLISFIKNVIGEEIEIEVPKPLSHPPPPPPPPHNLALQKCEVNYESNERQRKFGYSGGGRRWPQDEVQALISSRGEVEEKTGVHKGAIWDEISARMKERGYDRSAKKCKEKWENMNKYYKRVTEGGKKQPEHSKTRSYFGKLADLYKTTNSSGDKDE